MAAAAAAAHRSSRRESGLLAHAPACHLSSCRLAVEHSRLLQDFASRLPAACGGAGVTTEQVVAVETQASTAALCAALLMQSCTHAQLPGSVAYRLASNASLAVFTSGTLTNRWYLERAVLPAAPRHVAGSVSALQCTPLDMVAAVLSEVPGGEGLQQLYGRTVAGAATAAEWLACTAQAMCFAWQWGELWYG